MGKRDKAWRADIYDLKRERPVKPATVPELDIDDLAARSPIDDTPSHWVAPATLGAEVDRLRKAPAVLPDYGDEDENEDDLSAPPPTRLGDYQPSAPTVLLLRNERPAKEEGDNSLLLGLLLGSLAGAGLAMLVTPSSGPQVRARLRLGAAGTGAGGLARNVPYSQGPGADATATGEQE